MRISFRSHRLAKACSIKAEMRTAFGARMADVLGARLQDLEAAKTLALVSRLPPCRCHELKGNRKGQLAVDLVHPYRLIFVPDHDPEPLNDDGGLDWARVTQILVVDVTNYH